MLRRDAHIFFFLYVHNEMLIGLIQRKIDNIYFPNYRHFVIPTHVFTARRISFHQTYQIPKIKTSQFNQLNREQKLLLNWLIDHSQTCVKLINSSFKQIICEMHFINEKKCHKASFALIKFGAVINMWTRCKGGKTQFFYEIEFLNWWLKCE